MSALMFILQVKTGNLQGFYHSHNENDDEAKERIAKESDNEEILIGRIPMLSKESMSLASVSHAALGAIMALDIEAKGDLENILTQIFKLGYEFGAEGGRCNFDK